MYLFSNFHFAQRAFFLCYARITLCKHFALFYWIHYIIYWLEWLIIVIDRLVLFISDHLVVDYDYLVPYDYLVVVLDPVRGR